MNAASTSPDQHFRPRLLERRERLRAASVAAPAGEIDRLLREIDAALSRLDGGCFGICETCGDPIEPDRLECDCLTRFCLDHLNAAEMQAHQHDLELAAQIQARLLPASGLVPSVWDTHYHYQPVGAVGGDYCELTPVDSGQSLFFAVGDVSGKGVAASLLMTHLSAIFRSLVPMNLPLVEIVSRANRLFGEGTPDTHFATLACGFASEGQVEICNAGHCVPLLVRGAAVQRFEASGLPLGLFPAGRYEVCRAPLAPGDSLVLYSDGITESRNPAGDEYGEARLLHALRSGEHFDARAMADAVLRDVAAFRLATPPADDVTLLIVRRQC